MSTIPHAKRNFVPATPPRQFALWTALRALFAALFTQPTSATPNRKYDAVAPVLPAIIYRETPVHVHYVRDRGQEARRLLHRYLKGAPTSRRPCCASGMSEGAWARARKTLMRAGILDRKARLLYHGRDAQLRLDAYLDSVEQRAYTSGRYVAP